MTPIYQTRRGTEGNCWAACIASFLDLPLAETDHCGAPHTRWWYNTQELLAKHGLFYVEVPLPPEDEKGERQLLFTIPPNGALLLVGCNTERKLPHVVIGRLNHLFADDDHSEGKEIGWGIEIVHDPMPGGSEITSIDAIILLCRLQK